MFTVTTIEIGGIKVGSKRTIEFPFTDVKAILKVTSPCDCTDLSNENGPNGVVRVVYTAKDIPPHLKQMGMDQYRINKMITVTYESLHTPEVQTTINLTFTGTVKLF